MEVADVSSDLTRRPDLRGAYSDRSAGINLVEPRRLCIAVAAPGTVGRIRGGAGNGWSRGETCGSRLASKSFRVQTVMAIE